MISITVCDDDKRELEDIEKLISKSLKNKHVDFEIHAFDSSVNLFYELEDHHITDIYALDISMPQKDGFTVAEEIRKVAPNAVIIFLTSHGELATVGYKYSAHRYVLKLQMQDDLPEAITSAICKLPSVEEKTIVVRHYNNVWKIPYSNIVSVTRVGRYLQILTETQGTVKDGRGIKEFFEFLDDDRYLFIDRGCFINVDFVSQITGSSMKLTTGHILPISRRSMQSVKSVILHRWGV